MSQTQTQTKEREFMDYLHAHVFDCPNLAPRLTQTQGRRPPNHLSDGAAQSPQDDRVFLEHHWRRVTIPNATELNWAEHRPMFITRVLIARGAPAQAVNEVNRGVKWLILRGRSL
jgi:hypothetical protein